MIQHDEMTELRRIARELRFEPDEAMVERLRARVSGRLASRVTVWEILAAWFRPVALTLATMLLVLGIFLARQDSAPSFDLLVQLPQSLVGQELSIDVD
jgi:hypothetical protein